MGEEDIDISIFNVKTIDNTIETIDGFAETIDSKNYRYFLTIIQHQLKLMARLCRGRLVCGPPFTYIGS